MLISGMAIAVSEWRHHLECVDVVALGEEMKGVCDEDDRLAVVAESTNNGVGKKTFSNVSIDCMRGPS